MTQTHTTIVEIWEGLGIFLRP